MKIKITKLIGAGLSLLLLVAVIFIFAFHDRILLKTAQFMAPVGDYRADVAILEGHEVISRGIIKCGTDLLQSGRVKRMVIVLQNVSHGNTPYGISERYPDVVKNKLIKLGLEENDFKVVLVPVAHPITLTEAKVVLDILSKDNIKSALLLSSGFHTRRSYLIYQHIAEPLKIRIFPCAYFDEGDLKQHLDQEQGTRELVLEFLKLGYYLVKGYIPWKFSYPEVI